uniref:Uncharacterized protein n=1 Tax=Aegilops tauschii subsp. strangulata TaxID=200361 RepID=A0A453PWT7_AEGTS
FKSCFLNLTLRDISPKLVVKRKTSCDNLEVALTKDGKSGIDANELYVELMFLQNFIPKENIGSVEILKFLKRMIVFPM